jgi:DNA invertase Pin-like site-specific DNA recombinase
MRPSSVTWWLHEGRTVHIRISTIEQNSGLQRTELEKFLELRGWENAGVYEDVMSGARPSRPGLNALMADAAAGKFDVVAVWKLDRFGRSVIDCLNNIQKLEEAGVRFVSVTQNLDTSHADPAGWFMLHVLAAAAEFERSLIKERVASGIRQAKREGKRMGRPKLVFRHDEVYELRERGLTLREISERMNLTVATVHRALKMAA